MPSEAEWLRFETRMEAHFKEQRDMNEALHERITDHMQDDSQRFGEIREAFAQHIMAPCPDAKLTMKEHVDAKHNPTVFWSIVGIVTAAMVAIGQFVSEYFKGHK